MTPPSKTITFDLEDSAPWEKLSAGIRTSLTEAAVVMLTLHHTPGTSCDGTWVHDGSATSLRVTWSPADPTTQASHGNTKDATEAGAYAIAIHAVTALGWIVLGRLQQGSGADWHVLDPQKDKPMKLEVSGISENGKPGARLKQKVLQAKGGLWQPDWGGMAVVFRFQDAGSWSEVW